MRWLDILKHRLRTLLHRDSVDRELEEDLRHHLELHIQRNLEAGMAPAEARAAALRATGGVAHIQEECRDARASATWQISRKTCAMPPARCAAAEGLPSLRSPRWRWESAPTRQCSA